MARTPLDSIGAPLPEPLPFTPDVVQRATGIKPHQPQIVSLEDLLRGTSLPAREAAVMGRLLRLQNAGRPMTNAEAAQYAQEQAAPGLPWYDPLLQPNLTVGGNVAQRGGPAERQDFLAANQDLISGRDGFSPTARAKRVAKEGMAKLAQGEDPLPNPWAMSPQKQELDDRAAAILTRMAQGQTANPANRGAFSEEFFVSPTDRGGGTVEEGTPLGMGHKSTGLRFNWNAAEREPGPTPQTSQRWQEQHAQRKQDRQDAREAQTARAQARAMGGVAYDRELLGDGPMLAGMNPEDLFRMAALNQQGALGAARLAEDARQFDTGMEHEQAVFEAAQSPEAIHDSLLQQGRTPAEAAIAKSAVERNRGIGSAPLPGEPDPILTTPDEAGDTLDASLRDMVASSYSRWEDWLGRPVPTLTALSADDRFAALAEEVHNAARTGMINAANRDAVAELLRREVDRLGKERLGDEWGIDRVVENAARLHNQPESVEYLLNLLRTAEPQQQ